MLAFSSPTFQKLSGLITLISKRIGFPVEWLFGQNDETYGISIDRL